MPRHGRAARSRRRRRPAVGTTSLAGGSRTSQATTRSTVGSPATGPRSPGARSGPRRAPTGSRLPGRRGPPRRRPFDDPGQLHGVGPHVSAASRSNSKSSRFRQRSMLSRVSSSMVASGSPRYACRCGLRSPAWVSLPDRRRAGPRPGPSPGSRAVGRLMCPDGPPRGEHPRSSGPRTSAPDTRGRVRTRPPRRARRRAAVDQHREPGGLFRDGSRSSGLAGQPHQEVLTPGGTRRSSSRSMPSDAPARQREQAWPGSPAAGRARRRSGSRRSGGSSHPWDSIPRPG